MILSKKIMRPLEFVMSVADFLEIIHVQLPNKRSEFGIVVKISGKDFDRKLFFTADNKRVSSLIPSYSVIVLGLIFNDFPKLLNKKRYNVFSVLLHS